MILMQIEHKPDFHCEVNVPELPSRKERGWYISTLSLFFYCYAGGGKRRALLIAGRP